MRTSIRSGDIPHVRIWRGQPLVPLEEVLMFHRGEGPVPQTLRGLQESLKEAGLEYIVIGAAARAAYQFRRATEDVDLCMREADLARFRELFVGTRFQSVEGRSRRFYDPQTQVTFDILVSGRLAGRPDRNKTVFFPDPSEAVIRDGLPTVTLERLIALRLVTWRYKDFADVIALIRANQLDDAFAERLPPEVRTAYRECWDAKNEEDRYDQEHV
jgi:hypothetical protein